METLSAAFQCLVCMGPLQDAHLCPKCSKFFCKECIIRWVSRHRQCPHCRCNLSESSLVKCGWVSDVTASIARLETTHATTIAQTPTRPSRPATETIPEQSEGCPQGLCQIHKAHKDVFCTTCTSAICHKCGCFSILHRGHDMKPLSEVYEEMKRSVQEKIDAVKVRNEELEILITDYDRNAEEIRNAKEQGLVQIQNFVSERIKSLEENANERNVEIERYRKVLRDEIEKNKASIARTQRETEALDEAELLQKRRVVESSLDQLVAEPISSFVYEPVTSQFKDELNPKWNTGTFTVENFEEELSSNMPLYSGSIHHHGMTWQLKVYPNGNEMAQNSHLSVFLQLSNATPLHSSAKYTYQFTILDRHDKSIYEKEFTSEFAIGECWGYNRFLSLRRVNNLLVDGDLKLKFSVRPESFPIAVRDLENYINFITLGGADLAEELQQHPLNETNAADRSLSAELLAELSSDDNESNENAISESISLFDATRNFGTSDSEPDDTPRPNSAPVYLVSSSDTLPRPLDYDEADTEELLLSFAETQHRTQFTIGDQY